MGKNKPGNLSTGKRRSLKKAYEALRAKRQRLAEERIRASEINSNNLSLPSKHGEEDRIQSAVSLNENVSSSTRLEDEQMAVDEHDYSLKSKHREEDVILSAPLLEENDSLSTRLEDEQIRVDKRMMDKQNKTQQSPKDEETIIIICDDLASEHQEKDVQIQRSDLTNVQTLNEINQFSNVSKIKQNPKRPVNLKIITDKMVLNLKQKLKKRPKISNVVGIKERPIPQKIQQFRNKNACLLEENDSSSTRLENEQIRVNKQMMDKQNKTQPSPKDEETIMIICDDLSSKHQEKDVQIQRMVLANGQKLKEANQNFNFPETKQVFTPPDIQQFENKELKIETVEKQQIPNKEEEKISLPGRRIVDLAFVLEQIATISAHGTKNCGWKSMEFQVESLSNWPLSLYFTCSICDYFATLKTIRDPEETDDRVVLGCLAAGIGLAQFEDICGALDMPVICQKRYVEAEKRVSERVRIEALKSMKEAAQEEAKICRELNSVDESGTPLLTVITDGAWSKRSYKTKFNAKSGVASIIGAQTKKILYLGVKNTYCSMCIPAKNLNKIPKPHKCYLNWTGTSTSMESSILVEGFQKSMEMHGVIYDRLIADGDSSTMRHLQDAQPYGPNRQIKKIECKNHLLRNYCSKLKELAKNRTSSSNKMVPAGLRQQLKMKAMPLRSAVSSAIAFRKQEDGPISEQVEKLREDLLNGPSHVFGEHAKCIERGYFCQHEPVQGGIVEEMRQCGLFDDIMAILNRLLKHLDSLYIALTNNVCESYNSVVNKFVGGKRINFTQTGGYERRCFAAALHFNSKGRTILDALQLKGEFTNKYIKTRIRNYNRICSRRKRIHQKCLGADSDYGLVEDLDL